MWSARRRLRHRSDRTPPRSTTARQTTPLPLTEPRGTPGDGSRPLRNATMLSAPILATRAFATGHMRPRQRRPCVHAPARTQGRRVSEGAVSQIVNSGTEARKTCPRTRRIPSPSSAASLPATHEPGIAVVNRPLRADHCRHGGDAFRAKRDKARRGRYTCGQLKAGPVRLTCHQWRWLMPAARGAWRRQRAAAWALDAACAGRGS